MHPSIAAARQVQAAESVAESLKQILERLDRIEGRLTLIEAKTSVKSDSPKSPSK